MHAPNRSATVQSFYAAHREYFTADRHDENRRRSLPALIAHLESVHPDDRGKWGVLVKTDQRNKVPCDVLVWKDTRESIDVMDSTGGLWAPHERTVDVVGGGAWLWAPAAVVDPSGEERALIGPPYDHGGSSPEPPPSGGIDLAALSAKLDAIAADVASLRTLVEQLLQRPATTPAAVTFPQYEGTVNLGPLGNQSIVLRPRHE
jgi:hypothetical protein